MMTALTLAVLTLASTPALAESNKLDGRSNDPSYEVKDKTLSCDGDTCSIYVINDKSMGVVVKGKSKKETKKKAKEKADDLNEEAEENSVSTEEDGVFDTCRMFPQTC